MIEFDAPKEMSSMIKVVGVGGGGSNAVNHMFKQGIRGVDFIICNTDAQALDISPIPNKIQLGSSLTGGRGAGAIPDVGKNAAIENVDELKELLDSNTEMLFITAGMGGGTGTGAAPVIASVARDLGILTVGIVTVPFKFEGRKRRMQAEAGIEELRKHVDTLLIISNDKLRELHGNLTLTQAFGKADDILTFAARGIAEIITVTGYVNVDIEDVKTVMRDSGVAIMGSGFATGEDRAIRAVETALSSPLLNDNNIQGASNILLFMSSGSKEMDMDEVATITDYIQDEAGLTADIIWGNGNDETLEEGINVTVIATGFDQNSDVEKTAQSAESREPKKVIHELKDEKEEVAKNQPINNDIADDGMRIITRPTVTTDSDINIVSVESVEPVVSNESKPETIYNSVEPLIKSETENITIYNLDGEKEVVNRSEHEIKRRRLEEEAPEVNREFNQRTDERMNKLRERSFDFSAKDNLNELETTPAYIRRGVALSETPDSKENNVSRYTLDGENGRIKSNNSFLHDNVD